MFDGVYAMYKESAMDPPNIKWTSKQILEKDYLLKNKREGYKRENRL